MVKFEAMSCCRVNMISIPECVSTIVLPTGLTAGTYTVRITDRFNKAYNKDFEVDADGNMTIETDGYPSGIFTRYSGTAMLEIYDGCERQTINQCDTDYGYVTVSFYASDNTGVSPYTDTETFTLCCN